jgi:type I restriction enzyme R subunit
MNEAQTRLDLIDPALRAAGWNVVPESRIKVEVITSGRIIGKNHKGENLTKKAFADELRKKRLWFKFVFYIL